MATWRKGWRGIFSQVSWITPGAGDYTGDGRGDLAVVSVAPDTGETTATVRTSDVPYRTAAAAGTLTGAVLTTVPPIACSAGPPATSTATVWATWSSSSGPTTAWRSR